MITKSAKAKQARAASLKIHATGAQIIVHLLESFGIKTVAGIPGGSILPLYDELYKSQIQHILVRQEQAAGFIAQGIARTTGMPAVCLATSGPGAMNLLTSIADARCDSIPIVAITGQVNTNLIGTDAFQEADTFGLSFPITKHSVMVKNPLDLLTAIPEAFAIAQSGRPGPVLVDVPRDVQAAECEFDEWPDVNELAADNKTSARDAKTQADSDDCGIGYSEASVKFRTIRSVYPALIEKMADMLCAAKKPVLYAGGGANTAQGSYGIKKLLAEYPMPVVTSLMGIGVVQKSSPLLLGMVGMHGSIAANRAMYESDCILVAGARFDDRATGLTEKFCPHARILHIDIDAAEINKIVSADVSIVADVESIVPLLAQLISEKKHEKKTEWILQMQKIADKEKLPAKKTSGKKAGCVDPREFIVNIPNEAAKAGIKPSDIIVTTDVGQHQMWAAQYYPVESPRTFLTSGSLGTMGFGLPVAIGAALGAKHDAKNNAKRIICISGDGSILMNVQELATLADLGLDVTVIVLKNGTLGMVYQQQKFLFENDYSASVFAKQPDLCAIANGFGIPSVDADKEKDWYKTAFPEHGPSFVCVRVDPEELVLPYVKAGHANVDAIK
jgi:acetolactate synthase-1/2/3 large subunit